MPRPVHELKTWPEAFRGLTHGLKMHEVRKWDRDFQVGDVLRLREWDPDTKEYTGNDFTVEITWLTDPSTYGMPVEFVVMSVRPVILGPTGD